jgi:hypothetical protein
MIRIGGRRVTVASPRPQLATKPSPYATVLWHLFERCIRHIEAGALLERPSEAALCARTRLIIQTWLYVAVVAATGDAPTLAAAVQCCFSWGHDDYPPDAGFVLGHTAAGHGALGWHCAHETRCLETYAYLGPHELAALSGHAEAVELLSRALGRCLPQTSAYKVTIDLDRASAAWVLGERDGEQSGARLGETVLYQGKA